MKRKSAMAVIIILFMCVAVYLNLKMPEVESDDVRLKATLAGEEVEEKSEGAETSGGEDYFAEARLEKQKARDSAISTLKEAVKGDGFSDEIKKKTAASIETISTGAIVETRIETLVKAKGYDECVALINDKGASVIVAAPEEGLSQADTTKIKDIVVSETGISPEEIKIVEIK